MCPINWTSIKESYLLFLKLIDFIDLFLNIFMFFFMDFNHRPAPMNGAQQLR